MKSLLIPALAALFIPALSSCTGDPSQGGIFWSEQGAQQRLADRQDKLNQIKSDTKAVHADSRQKQKQINELSSER